MVKSNLILEENFQEVILIIILLLGVNIMDLTESYNILFKEHIRKILSDKSTPQKVYHYTDIHGFKGILENNMFWISHIDFLNDMTEIKYTLKLSREIMISLCEEEGLNQNVTKSILDEYDKMIELYFVENKMNYYSLSFSVNQDSNLLWSNYSQNDGYCIMFDIEKLIKGFEGKGYHVLYSHVNYDITKQKEILKEQVLINIFNLLKILNMDISLSKEDYKEFFKVAFSGDYGEESLGALSTEAFEKLEEISSPEILAKASAMILLGALELIHCCSIFFKDECFSQEEEFRLAIYFPNNKENYKCRISNGTFIPYIEMEFQKDSVSGVTIGPKNNMDINLEGLRKFLELEDIQIATDEIKKSRIPYRF